MGWWSPLESNPYNISLVRADCPPSVGIFFAVLVRVVIVHLALFCAALELVVSPLGANVAVGNGAAIAGDGHGGGGVRAAGGGDGGRVSLAEQEAASAADKAATAASTVLHPLLVPVSLPVVMLEERQLSRWRKTA